MKTEQMCELNPRQMLPGSRSMKSNEYFIKNCTPQRNCMYCLDVDLIEIDDPTIPVPPNQ